MRFTSLQENLKKGLNIVGHINSKNINLPILNNILINTKKTIIEFTSTNLEIGIKHQVRGKVEQDGEFTVDARLINEYISLLESGKKVEVELKDEELGIKCDNYKTKIKGESAKEYPLIPTISKESYFSCNLSNFKESLAKVIFAVSNNENRTELTGVLFYFLDGKLFLVATDSYRLAEKELVVEGVNTKEEEQKVIVPAKTIQELLRILNNFEEGESEIKIYLSENQILFSFDSVEMISRTINGHYPDYKQIIPSSSQTEVLVDRDELIRAVKAVALFSKTGINDITLTFTKNKLTISSFSGASGESQVELDCNLQGEVNDLTINYRYLLDGLNNINGEMIKIKILNNTTPCLLKPEDRDDYLYIVMPIKQ
ncbi:MAG: DNA polymerase III subunit beta [Patescibacteria group bacterium]|jgi:DNA polymerase-3 subunit beta